MLILSKRNRNRRKIKPLPELTTKISRYSHCIFFSPSADSFHIHFTFISHSFHIHFTSIHISDSSWGSKIFGFVYLASFQSGSYESQLQEDSGHGGYSRWEAKAQKWRNRLPWTGNYSLFFTFYVFKIGWLKLIVNSFDFIFTRISPKRRCLKKATANFHDSSAPSNPKRRITKKSQQNSIRTLENNKNWNHADPYNFHSLKEKSLKIEC